MSATEKTATEKQSELAGITTRKQALESMVSANTANLLNIEANNPSVRALVLRQTGLNIPAELTTFAAVKQWMESQDMPKPQPAKPFEIAVAASQVEKGTCRFRRTAYASKRIAITPQSILELAKNSADMEEFSSNLRSHIDDVAQENINLNNHENSEHYEHDVDESEDFGTDYSWAAVMTAVKQILPREEWNRLADEAF